MRIALAQIQSFRGDVQANLEKHIQWVKAADADMIIFPELSLTGYEPSMAAALVQEDGFDQLQALSNEKRIIICAGMPVPGIHIGMHIYQPHKPVELYIKQYLHEDELPFFTPGTPLPNSLHPIAMAICYEISIPAHALHAHDQGAQTYIASVAKTAKGVEKAMKQLKAIAKQYSMTVLMVNAVGMCEDGECAGRSAIWNNTGELLAQLNSTEEGLLYSHT